jgi:cobalt-zinc-cadmium efflux system outer membrane protein
MRRSLFVFLSLLPLSACAQAALTEAEALRLGLARIPLAELAEATAEAASADVLRASQLPNPMLGYSRERTGGSPRTVEQSLHIAQTFQLSGRRELQTQAASRRFDMAEAGSDVRRAELAAEIKNRFYEVLLKQELIRSTETWIERFGRVQGVIEKLASAGEVSGYDRRRLERERQAANARLAIEAAELGRAQERLAALIGASELSTATVSGALLPAQPIARETDFARLDQRPDLRVLSARAEAAELERRAAALEHIPDVTVGLGPKWVDNGMSRENGVMLTLSVPLPVFDRGQAAQKRAAAEAAAARAEYQLARARAEGELRGLQRQIERLTSAAKDYRARVLAMTPELLRIAESAYRGGESSILELLDAYRGALESEATALDLESKVRVARIEYDLQSGSYK